MFAALIDCAIRAGKESYAFDAFDAMKEANIPPTMATYNRLIHACGQKGTANGFRDAVRLYEYVWRKTPLIYDQTRTPTVL